MQTPEGPAQVAGMRVSADFFRVLGTRPIHGRDFLSEEDRPGASHVAIVSRRFWHAQFGGDAGVVGKALQLDDEDFIVIGKLRQRELR